MRFVLFILMVFIFIGCSVKKEKIEIYDLTHIPQNIKYFTKNIDNNGSLYSIQYSFEEKYFSMWNIQRPNEKLQDIKWPFNVYKYGNSYGENLRLIKKDFFDKMYEKANFDSYLSVSKKAITIKHTNFRSFATDKPLFRDPNKAGEGFPFDYLQNSSISANKPLFISHYSKDKEWVYAFSSFASGWLKSSDIVFLEQIHTDEWQKAQQLFFIKEDIPLYDEDGKFVFKSKIGMMLPIIAEEEDYYKVLVVSSYPNLKPFFTSSIIPKDIVTKKTLSLDGNNLEKIIKEASNVNYGWGGMYGQRDCSSSLRDIFTPFGIWLPRNSYKQSKVGEVISLKDLSDDEKSQLIKEKAISFQTLLYKRGHIMLYIGTYNNEVIIYHNTWGIKTLKDGVEGRIIIGKPIISSLSVGENQKYYDESSKLLTNLKSFNILTK